LSRDKSLKLQKVVHLRNEGLGARLDSVFSAKILAMIVSLRQSSAGWSVLSVAGRTSSSKTWLSVGNCWRCTRNDLAVD